MSELQFDAAKRVMAEDSEALRLLAKDREIERLRELVAAAKEDRKAIDELVDENLRLSWLLRQCQPYIAGWPEARELFSEIEKEVRNDPKTISQSMARSERTAGDV